MRDKVVTK